MPAMAVMLSIVLGALIRPILARVLSALGLTIVTYQGVGLLVDQLMFAISGAFSGSSLLVLSFVSLLGIDDVITLIISAHVGALSLRGIYDGARRMAYGSSPTDPGV